MHAEQTSASFYRCQISAENSKATLKGNGHRIPVVLRESAIDGFTVTIAEKHARRLTLGRTWVLKTSTERNHVHAEWVFHSRGQEIQVGLRRVGEIIESEEPRGGLATYFGRTRLLEQSNYAELAFGALVLTIIVMLSSPGVGEKLGTAPLIHEVAAAAMNFVGSWFR